MTAGVGGSSAKAELEAMESIREGVAPIGVDERRVRIRKAQALMKEQGAAALWLDATTSLRYFTGVRSHASERLHGAVLPAEGDLAYLCPAFEEAKLRQSLILGDDVRTGEEHEDPTALVLETVASLGCADGPLALDEATPFFVYDGLRRNGPGREFVNGKPITAGCRAFKTPAELALMQRAMDICWRVQAATARILRDGITTTEVEQFINEAHPRLGTDGPPCFAIVLFGEPTAYPHGVDYPQTLAEGDMVLIDTGATLEGYQSDLTRTYVYGSPSARQREVWEVEHAAQAAAFAAARVGRPCEEVDAAARRVIEAAGFGPDYAVPGLPHRTGHGIGLDGHEWEYLVRGNRTPLASGMCFSDEPMICSYGEFGVRLEDCFFMTEDTAQWFTQPSPSIDDPFGVA